MKLYVAGPMTGYKYFNFPMFLWIAAWLRAQGHEVLSPAEKDIENGYAQWDAVSGDLRLTVSTEYLLALDVRLICKCEAVVLLPGWKESPGVSLELAAAWKDRDIRLFECYPSIRDEIGGPQDLADPYARGLCLRELEPTLF